MRFAKLKLITASALILLGSQSGIVLASDNTASQNTGQASSAAQAPAATQTPQPAYRGYGYPRYNRGYHRPFGGSGPDFRGPRNRGSGSGFGFGSDDGPAWGSGPSFGRGGPGFGSGRDPFFDDPFKDDPFFDRGRGFHDRGPGFRDPWDRGSGSGFGFGSDDGPGWGSGPSFGSGGPGFGSGRDPFYDRDRGFHDRGPSFRGPWDRGRGSGMGFGL